MWQLDRYEHKILNLHTYVSTRARPTFVEPDPHQTSHHSQKKPATTETTKRLIRFWLGLASSALFLLVHFPHFYAKSLPLQLLEEHI